MADNKDATPCALPWQGKQIVNIDLNAMATVKLTADGAEIFNAYMVQFPAHVREHAEPGDVKELPVWTVMRVFGWALQMEMQPPFESMQVAGEPVAWRWRTMLDNGKWGDWRHTNYKPQGEASPTFEIVPLFAQEQQHEASIRICQSERSRVDIPVLGNPHDRWQALADQYRIVEQDLHEGQPGAWTNRDCWVSLPGLLSFTLGKRMVMSLPDRVIA